MRVKPSVESRKVLLKKLKERLKKVSLPNPTKRLSIDEFITELFKLSYKDILDLTYVLDDIGDIKNESEYKELFDYARGLLNNIFADEFVKKSIDISKFVIEDNKSNTIINNIRNTSVVEVAEQPVKVEDEEVIMSEERTFVAPEELNSEDAAVATEVVTKPEVVADVVETIVEVVTGADDKTTAETSNEVVAEVEDAQPEVSTSEEGGVAVKARRTRKLKPRNIIRVGSRVAELRKERGLTQKGLADIAGITQGYISLIERNNSNVRPAQLDKLATAFGITPDELLKGLVEEVVNGETTNNSDNSESAE